MSQSHRPAWQCWVTDRCRSKLLPTLSTDTQMHWHTSQSFTLGEWGKTVYFFIFIISQQSGSVSFMRGSCHQKLIPPTSRTFCISLCCCCVQTLSCAFLKVKWKFGIHLFCCFYNPLLTINEFSGSERMTASLEQRGYKIWHNVGMVQIDFTQASLSNHL